MTERWARPARILDIEEEPTMVFDGPDGRRWGVPRITIDEDTKERIRLGYMCMLCFEPFQVPWPDVCGFCGARVKDGQGAYFERMYKGVDPTIANPVTEEEDIAAFYEQLERERIERGLR